MSLRIAYHWEPLYPISFESNAFSKTIPLQVNPFPGNWLEHEKYKFLVSKETERCLGLCKAIEKTVSELAPEKAGSISLHLNFYNNCKSLDVTLSGEILKKIHDIVFWGHERETESLKFVVEISTRDDPIYNLHLPIARFTIQDFEQNCNSPLMAYEKKGIEFPKDTFQCYHTACIENYVENLCEQLCTFNITVKIQNIDGYVPLLQPGLFAQVNSSSHLLIVDLMIRGKPTDFEIIAKDGTHIPCYKQVLCAQSKTLKMMIIGERNYMNRQRNRLDLHEVSAEAAKGLVDYLQFRNLDALMIPNVALELFMLADKYKIYLLLVVCRDVLVGKSHSWYDLETADNMLAYSIKNGGKYCAELREKAINVIEMKRSVINKKIPWIMEVRRQEDWNEKLAKTLAILKGMSAANVRKFLLMCVLAAIFYYCC